MSALSYEAWTRSLRIFRTQGSSSEERLAALALDLIEADPSNPRLAEVLDHHALVILDAD